MAQSLLQPERPGHGRPALRVRAGQTVRGAEALRPPPDYSEENQEQVADHFQVSYRTINTLVLNNVDIRDEDRVLLQ